MSNTSSLASGFDVVGDDSKTLVSVARSFDDDLEVQIRTTPWRNTRVASVATAIAVLVEGDRIALYSDRSPPLLIDGVPTALQSQANSLLPSGGMITRSGSRYTVEWMDGSENTFLKILD